MDALFIAIIFVALYKSKYVSANDTYLSKDSTLSIKGICAVLIVLHHISYYDRSGFLFPVFLHIGYLVVGLFFLISGYGLTIQYQKKGQSGYWSKRFMKLLLPYLIAAVVYYLLNLSKGTVYSFSDPLARLARGYMLVPYCWYIFATIIFYGLFQLSCLLSKNNHLVFLVTLTVLVAGYCAIAYLLDFTDVWLMSAFAFPLGSAICIWKDRFTDVLKKHYWITAIICFAAFLSLFLLKKFTFSYYIIDNLSVIFFCLSTIIVMYRIKIGNPIIHWLGVHSYEIYLYHGCFVHFFRIGQGIVYGSLSVLITLLIAYIIHRVHKILFRALKIA